MRQKIRDIEYEIEEAETEELRHAELVRAAPESAHEALQLLDDAWDVLHDYLFNMESDLSSEDRYRSCSYRLHVVRSRAQELNDDRVDGEIARIGDLMLAMSKNRGAGAD